MEPVGYTDFGGAYHAECLPEDLDPNSEELYAVFGWSDDAHELTCDRAGCHQRLDEPSNREEQ